MYAYPEALNGIERILTDYAKAVNAQFGFNGKNYRNINLRVVADSTTGTASVDWKENSYFHGQLDIIVNMPVKPSTYRMSSNEFDHWAAYALHELGHPMHTDKAVWDKAVAARQHRMLNATDDVRQEKLTIDMKLALNARAAFSALVDSLLAKSWAEGYNPNRIGSFGWTIAVLGRAQNGYDIDVARIWKSLNPIGPVRLCLDWALPRLAKCKTTQDCLDLSNEISAFLAKFKKPGQGEGEGDMPTNPGQGQPQDGEGDGEVDQDDTLGDETADGPQGGQTLPSEGEGKAGKGGQGAGKGDPDAEQKPLNDDDFDAVGLQPNQKDVMSGSGAYVEQQITNILRQALKGERKPKDISGRTVPGDRYGFGLNSFEYVSKNAARMGRQRALLARALKREEQDEFEGGRINGKFDTRRITKALQGDQHVFGRRELSEGYDTDVEILVDGSSSMSGKSIWASAALALVVAQAARQVGVDCYTHVFTDSGLIEVGKGKSKPDARKFSWIINQPVGGTPLCESMVKATKAQAARAKGKRRVLFLITDGGCGHGPAAMKGIGRYLESQWGVEIANIHIGRTPLGVFRNECAVDVQNVGKVGLEKLTALLERGV